MRTVRDGAASLEAMAIAMPSAGAVAVARAAELGSLRMRAALARSVGGDFRLRNAGRVGVRVTIGSDSASIGAVGPVHLLEDRVAPHEEEPRSRRALAGSLDHPVRGAVRHPGYPARRVWSSASRVTLPALGAPALEGGASPTLRNAYRKG